MSSARKVLAFEEARKGLGDTPVRRVARRDYGLLLTEFYIGSAEARLPVVRGDRWSNEPTVTLEQRGDFIRLCSLYVPAKLRRRGLASKLLFAATRLLPPDFADKPIFLEALPYADQPLDRDSLFGLYGRFGFKRVPGHPYAMVRDAK